MTIGIKDLWASCILILLAELTLLIRPAVADVVVSTDPTSNMTCSNGVCTPTDADSVLNVNDLETMLASGNVTLAAEAEPVDVDINAALSWPTANALTLDSYHAIRVNQPVAITDGGWLSIITNDGGTGGAFSFAAGANVSFSSLSSNLTINGTAYTLVGDIATLASDIAANANGSYALAADYDASRDGTYSASPVSTFFYGNFQGLGNSVSKLTISNASRNSLLGLFAFAEPDSSISNLLLRNATISESGDLSDVGILVGISEGTLFGDHTTGAVSGARGSVVGGLAGVSTGSSLESSASATVTAQSRTWVGGLLGGGGGVIDTCFATGQLVDNQGKVAIGALIGYSESAQISNSYATGSVKSGNNRYSRVGGFLGESQGVTILTSYSIGEVKAGGASIVGGFLGEYGSGTASDSYWDITTSGKKKGVGNGKIPGVTGLNSKKLKAQLPPGFDPSIWAEDESINNGFPYLITNPPK